MTPCVLYLKFNIFNKHGFTTTTAVSSWALDSCLYTVLYNLLLRLLWLPYISWIDVYCKWNYNAI